MTNEIVPETQRIRYAVVGLGNIAQVAVLPSFVHAEDNSELVALVSSDTEKLSALAKTYGVGHTGSYDEFERVVRDARVDAVYLAVPNAMHRPMTERAAAATRLELETFFVTVSEMTKKNMEIEGWDGPKRAQRAIEEAAQSYVRGRAPA